MIRARSGSRGIISPSPRLIYKIRIALRSDNPVQGSNIKKLFFMFYNLNHLFIVEPFVKRIVSIMTGNANLLSRLG